ncbi:HNH endonuclease [Caballeronia novacaledonica]|uniref:HNH endonuclease n=1 Tax=Caballeronia novacaledonica TaxID=1544861 RepID=A0ACB5QUI9_9BURK|nr:HNH endonuclease [Caballeronia novacaledonica]
MPISKVDKKTLEEAALSAFAGKMRTLSEGLEFRNEFGPLATVFWGRLSAGVDVEITLADNRLSERYKLDIVQRWLKRELRVLNAQRVARSENSNLPAYGFRFADAIEFLRGCRSVRLGILREALLTELHDLSRLETPEERQRSRLEGDRSALRPVRHQAVIDLVRKAKVDISRWYMRMDGTPAVTPRSNPAYCYNWAFGGGEEPAVGCFWFQSITFAADTLEIQANLQEWALKLERFVATEPDEKARDRARSQAKRARQLDELLRDAASGDGILRVIVVEGDMATEERMGRESSVVRLRHLDPEPWRIVSYDKLNGACILHRGKSENVSTESPASHAGEAPAYEDQHGTPGTDVPVRGAVTGSVFVRDPAVRASVLERSNGHCEYCDTPGFQTRNGRLYLETHHVIPLSENGPDRIWNVAALCPNHHREAHSGELAPAIRTALLAMLDDAFPPEFQDSEGSDLVVTHSN